MRTIFFFCISILVYCHAHNALDHCTPQHALGEYFVLVIGNIEEEKKNKKTLVGDRSLEFGVIQLCRLIKHWKRVQRAHLAGSNHVFTAGYWSTAIAQLCINIFFQLTYKCMCQTAMTPQRWALFNVSIIAVGALRKLYGIRWHFDMTVVQIVWLYCALHNVFRVT